MGVAASDSWKIGKGGPTTVDALRADLLKRVAKASGPALISEKFSKDHRFLGHEGKLTTLAAKLAKLRDLPKSTIMISEMGPSARKEVANWIRNCPDSKFSFSAGTWKISKQQSTVAAAASYKFATVDLKELKGMDKDDIQKKSRKWMKESQKTPKVGCLFGSDGIPVIYHLDY